MALELKGQDVLKIKKTPLRRAYNSEKEGFKGKHYLIYSYRDSAFIVHEDDQFNIDFTNGTIFSLELNESDEGLSLLNHQTITQVKNMTQVIAEIKIIEASPAAVTLNPVANYEALS